MTHLTDFPRLLQIDRSVNLADGTMPERGFSHWLISTRRDPSHSAFR